MVGYQSSHGSTTVVRSLSIDQQMPNQVADFRNTFGISILSDVTAIYVPERDKLSVYDAIIVYVGFIATFVLRSIP